VPRKHPLEGLLFDKGLGGDCHDRSAAFLKPGRRLDGHDTMPAGDKIGNFELLAQPGHDVPRLQCDEIEPQFPWMNT
jgi:hypothetical protein